MTKKDILKDLIPKILTELGPLVKDELRLQALKKDRDLDLISSNLLHESLTDLMREGVIEIVDYDFSIYRDVNQIQSIKSEGLVFDVIQSSPMDICALLEEISSNEPKNVIKANKKLKNQFKRKYMKLDDEKLKRWNHKIKSTYHYSRNELGDVLEKNVFESRFDKKIEIFTKKLNKIQPHGRIWFYDHFQNSKTPSPIELLKYSKTVVDEKNQMNEIQVLNRLGYSKPKKTSHKDIYRLYDETINYILFDLNQPEKNEYIVKLSKGLSDLRESLLIFEGLMREMKEPLHIKYEEIQNKSYYNSLE